MPIWPPSRPGLPDDVPDLESSGWPGHDVPDVHETENPVIGTILGADGAVLVEIRERRTVPFGFHRGDDG